MPARAALVACLALPPLACAAPTSGASESATGSTGALATSTGDSSSTGAAPTDGTSDSSSSGGEAPVAGPRLNHLQALGTHNSYHVSGGTAVVAWDYTHLPLDRQLDEQGVRHFELDLHFRGAGEPIDVYHVEALDTGTTCASLSDCLMTLRTWSDGHLQHHPLYVMLEIKSPYDAAQVAALLATLEQQIDAVWPEERRISPGDVQRDAASVREGLQAHGWPAIDAVRGRALFVLHDGGAWREAYTAGGTEGAVLFADAFGDLERPFAAVHSLNDPAGDAAAIAAALDAGHLVRTRADADNAEPSAGDDSRALAALASGAHFVSTDYPPPRGEKYDYVVELPGGTPSRCNPRTALPDCSAAAIEDPAAL